MKRIATVIAVPADTEGEAIRSARPRTKESPWYEFSSSTRPSPIPSVSSSTPSSVARSRAGRSATGTSSERLRESRSSATTRSGSFRTWTRSALRPGRRSSWRRARTRWRWVFPSTCTSQSSSSAGSRAAAPALAPGARLRVGRLREGTSARDRHAQQAGRAERVRLSNAARARASVRGCLVGRRHSRRGRHGGGPRLLRRRRPEVVGSRARRQLARVLEVVRGLQGHARPPARDRQADGRAHQRDLRGRRQRAADGVRPGGDGRGRLHPPRRPGAWIGAGRRSDAVASGHGRRTPRAGDHPALRRGTGRPGGGMGPRELVGTARGAGRQGGRGRREAGREAARDDALRETAAQFLARPFVARDRRTRARLAGALDARPRGQGGDRGIPDSLVLVEREEPIAIVLLNRPEQLNALSSELMDELVSALQELDRDEGVHCIVVGGSERAFAAGADIGELAQASPIDFYYGRRVERWDAIQALWTPLVAAVSGFCLGGGCELAMTCDLIIASETAKFGQPETGLGIMPGAGGTQRLTRAVGKAVAMDVILSGRMLTAQEALDAGLAARVVAKEAWLEEAKRVARDIASKGPVGIRLAKEAGHPAFERPPPPGVEHERRLLYLALASEDAREGLQAFLEKRKPEFGGR